MRPNANHTARWQVMQSDKQLTGLKLTSGSGEQTKNEVAITAQQGDKELIPDCHLRQLYHGH